MPFEKYKLGFKTPVQKQRLMDYRAGLLDPWEVVVLYQDMLEMECVPLMLYQHALHLIAVGLCHVEQRKLQ